MCERCVAWWCCGGCGVFVAVVGVGVSGISEVVCVVV